MANRVYGVILAGGASRRMGGSDKGRRDLGGKPLLAHVRDRLGPQCSGLVLSGSPASLDAAAFGLPVVADSIPGRQGPLAGVLAALDWIADHRPETRDAVTVPNDAPFIPIDLVARLARARERDGAVLACAASGKRIHPVCALWPVHIREGLRRALSEEGVRKAGLFLFRHPCAVAEWPTAEHDPFFNVNAPEDLIEASRLLAEMRGVPLGP